MKTLAREILEIRAARKELSRNERAEMNAVDYRDGYAAGWADYVSFKPARDLDGVVSLTQRNVAGYKAGYADAARGRASRWPSHSAPRDFALAA